MTTPVTRPEPVLAAARWASIVVGSVAALGTGFGAYGAVTHATWALGIAASLAAVTTGLAAVIPSMTAQGARAQVTPVASPQTMDGIPLVPADLTRSAAPAMGPDAA